MDDVLRDIRTNARGVMLLANKRVLEPSAMLDYGDSEALSVVRALNRDLDRLVGMSRTRRPVEDPAKRQRLVQSRNNLRAIFKMKDAPPKNNAIVPVPEPEPMAPNPAAWEARYAAWKLTDDGSETWRARDAVWRTFSHEQTRGR